MIAITIMAASAGQVALVICDGGGIIQKTRSHHGHDRERTRLPFSCAASFLAVTNSSSLAISSSLTFTFPQLVDIDFLHIRLARGPALLQAEHAADHFDDAPAQQKRPGDGMRS